MFDLSSLVMTDVVINGQQGPEFPEEAQCFLARANWSEVIDRDACAVKKSSNVRAGMPLWLASSRPAISWPAG